MKTLNFLVLAFLFLLVTCSLSFAGCYVEDSTFYSKDKHSIMTLAMTMEQGNLSKALQMVDDGKINSCSEASCVVLERLDSGFVHVNIMGIGKAWIYNTFLHCN